MVRSTDVDHARVCTPRRRFVPGVFVRPGSGRHCTPRRGDPRLHALCRLYGARGRSLDARWCRTFCCTAWKACLLYASSARRLAVGARRRRSSSGSGQRLREWPSLYASSWRSAAVRPLSAVRREGAVAGRALVQDVLLYGVEGVSVVVCVISTQPAVGARRRRSSSGPVSGCGGWPSLYVLVVATRGCTPSACCTARGGGRWTRVGAERSAVRRGRRVCRMRHQHAAGCRRSALAVIERVRSAAAGVAVTVRLVVAIRGCTPSALCTAWKAQPLDARWCRTFCCTAWKACLLYASSARSLVVGARRWRSSSGSGQGLPRRRRWRAHAVRNRGVTTVELPVRMTTLVKSAAQGDDRDSVVDRSR